MSTNEIIDATKVIEEEKISKEEINEKLAALNAGMPYGY